MWAKDTVEDYKSVSIFWLNKHDYLCGYRSGAIKWTNGLGAKTGSIWLAVSVDDYVGSVQFKYTRTDRFSDEKTEYDYKVMLTSTPCHFGGRRWWFICPLAKNGVPCNKRVGVLHLAGNYFGCRHCYDLTYRSCQDSHKFDGIFAEMGIPPKIGKALFKA